MDYRYQLTKILLILIFGSLYETIPINWIFFVCGLALPWIDLIISKEKYQNQFPWELYLFYGYAIYSIFFNVELHLIYWGSGYALSRFILYFQLKSIKT